MSLPVLPEPNPDLTQEQALNMILSSIAMEETALSHIMNAEGEKIQKILSLCAVNTQDIISVNNSVKDLLEVIFQTQIILKSKMDKALSHLPPPINNKSCKHFVRYAAIPGLYCRHQPIAWEKDYCNQPTYKLYIPFTGNITVDFTSELYMCKEYENCYYV